MVFSALWRSVPSYEHRFGVEAIKYFEGGWENKGWGFYEDEWNKPWQAKVSRNGDVRTAELAIPIASLEVDLDSDFWGLNLWAKTASGKTFAWSPTYQVKNPGGYYGPLWDHHVCRTKGTEYYYGILRGMKGMHTPEPYENMLRILRIGLEPQPDGTLAALAKVQRNIPLSEGELAARADVTLVNVALHSEGRCVVRRKPVNPRCHRPRKLTASDTSVRLKQHVSRSERNAGKTISGFLATVAR